VQVVWAYDEFYSLLMIEDKQLDSDGDGTLSEAELQSLAGNDVAWDQGFPGDLELRNAGGDLIELGRPLEHKVTYENGRIITTHIRPLTQHQRPDHSIGFSAKVFDPTYFVAYDLRLDIQVEPEQNCEFHIIRADIQKAMQQVDQMLFGPNAVELADGDYPQVGELFADKVVLTCASSS